MKGSTNARPDVSNLVSMLHDALEGICYLDDCQIVRCVSLKEKAAPTVRIVAVIEELL